MLHRHGHIRQEQVELPLSVEKDEFAMDRSIHDIRLQASDIEKSKAFDENLTGLKSEPGNCGSGTGSAFPGTSSK